MTSAEPWTVGRLLTWTTDFLKQHGSESPRLEAEVLLAHSRECQRIELYTAFDDEPSEDVKASFREIVRKRSEGTPVAYLVGYKEFYSLDFEVNEATLIPRPETEHLVVRALDEAAKLQQQSDRPLRVVDVGTGSGCIAIAFAKHFAGAEITAVDISTDALEVAHRNAQKHAVEDRITFQEADLLQALQDQPSFDLILSNPPYVSDAEYGALSSTVREHEPRQALVGGLEGYEVATRLVEECVGLITDNGKILVELSPMLIDKRDEFISNQWQTEVVKDLAGLSRILVLSRVLESDV